VTFLLLLSFKEMLFGFDVLVRDCCFAGFLPFDNRLAKLVRKDTARLIA
jgi:hypothetical protein